MKSKEQLFDDYFKKDSLAQEIRYDIERVISYAQEDAVKTTRERKYAILGLEYNEPMKHCEFYQDVISGILHTTDDWRNVKYYENLYEAEKQLTYLKTEYNDYGWYIVLI